jgi:hypothetical protein
VGAHGHASGHPALACNNDVRHPFTRYA